MKFQRWFAFVVLGSLMLVPGSVLGAIVSNQLRNAGFETGGGTSSSNWSVFGSAFREGTVARSGFYSTKIHGQFTGDWNYNGVYQDRPATPGQVWEGSAWMQNWSGDPMAGTNSACVRIDFYDAAGRSIWAVSSSEKLTASTPANTWVKSTVRATAPRQAVTARFVCLFVQPPSYDGGSAWFDDCEFGLSTQTNALRFSGLDWTVCEGETFPGYPDPNLFSTNSAYVDTNGWLHLRLTKVSNKWYCAQINTRETFGYGEYTWKLRGRPDLLNSNLVLGLFTYAPTIGSEWNEIDIELSHAFEGMSASNLQFAIQPVYMVEGNNARKIMMLSTNGSTHSFLWAPGDTRFLSYRGLGDAPVSTNDILHQWVYAGTNQPVHSNEVAFMNLWLYMTNAPAGTQNIEVVISDFRFTPFRGTIHSDLFDDSVRSNIWSLSGFEGGATPIITETNGSLGVTPTGDWLTAGYITAKPVNWNNRDAWTVFSARLSTIRVDQAISGVDMRAAIELVSEAPNAWSSTNAMALFALYDRDANTLTFTFATKTNRPNADGDERFRATLANAGSYLNVTNGIDMRLGVGRGQYRIELRNRQGLNLPVVTNIGPAQGTHQCGEALKHAFWMVGAMNESTGRGKVFWDRADAVVDMPVTNWAPLVDAGVDRTIALPSTLTLVGMARDDGLPSNKLTVAWSKLSGPGTVTFTNAATANTRASFTTNGVYVLRLIANDTMLIRTDTVQVTVSAAPVTNRAPVVNAGVDRTITLPASATLAGTATDDGLPSNKLTVAWSKLSGPGTVTFTNAATANTRARFSTNGVYVLRLIANDTLLSGTDTVQVTVNPRL